MRLPADCQTKEEVRAEIDRLDRELVALLAERFAYVRRMAELKKAPADAYDEPRVNEILAKVVAEARLRGLDPVLAQSLWRALMNWNIAWEARSIGKRTKAD